MRIEPKTPPRGFTVVGRAGPVTLSDCAVLHPEPDEQVTFVVPSGRELDVCRKAWGFYATPSTNGRLKRFGWRSALVRNADGLLFVMLVEPERLAEFERYCTDDGQRVLFWLDDAAEVARLTEAAAARG